MFKFILATIIAISFSTTVTATEPQFSPDPRIEFQVASADKESADIQAMNYYDSKLSGEFFVYYGPIYPSSEEGKKTYSYYVKISDLNSKQLLALN